MTKGTSVVAWTWGWGGMDGLQRKLLGIMDIFAILSTVMGFPGVYMCHHSSSVHFKHVWFPGPQLPLHKAENKQKRICVPPPHPYHTEDAPFAFQAERNSCLASPHSQRLEPIPPSPPPLPPQAHHPLTPACWGIHADSTLSSPHPSHLCLPPASPNPSCTLSSLHPATLPFTPPKTPPFHPLWISIYNAHPTHLLPTALA